MAKLNLPSNSDKLSWVRGKCIGMGSFGTVSLGVYKSDGRVFAVKSVNRNTCLSNQIESLENEIRILRSLSSPYVVGFLRDDVTYESLPTATASSYRNLHMEYLPGGTAADVPLRAHDVDEMALRSRLWCIVSALRYVHSKGIVHCDVKGRNILLDSDNPNIAKLADFGSAIDISAYMESKLIPIVPRGSPLWMAPEVIRRESQGPESDIWSLGCTIIEMVTGKPSWEDCGVDTLSRIGYSATELPEFPNHLSVTGRDFLEKCLRRDPSRRWSCDQLLQHPFLELESQRASTEFLYSSPRCVLDWINSEFEDGEDDEEIDDHQSSVCEKHAGSAKERIGKLSTISGAKWESDDWATVRFLANQEDSGVDELAGGNCSSCEEDGEGTSMEYSYNGRVYLEYTNASSRSLDYFTCNLGWSSRRGLPTQPPLRAISSFHNLSSCILFSYCWSIFESKLLDFVFHTYIWENYYFNLLFFNILQFSPSNFKQFNIILEIFNLMYI